MHQGDPVTEVKNALRIGIVMAKALVAEGLAQVENSGGKLTVKNLTVATPVSSLS